MRTIGFVSAALVALTLGGTALADDQSVTMVAPGVAYHGTEKIECGSASSIADWLRTDKYEVLATCTLHRAPTSWSALYIWKPAVTRLNLAARGLGEHRYRDAVLEGMAHGYNRSHGRKVYRNFRRERELGPISLAGDQIAVEAYAIGVMLNDNSANLGLYAAFFPVAGDVAAGIAVFASGDNLRCDGCEEVLRAWSGKFSVAPRPVEVSQQ